MIPKNSNPVLFAARELHKEGACAVRQDAAHGNTVGQFCTAHRKNGALAYFGKKPHIDRRKPAHCGTLVGSEGIVNEFAVARIVDVPHTVGH